MNILLFGASGFIGKNFLSRWGHKVGWKITATFHSDPKFYQFCETLPNVTPVSSEAILNRESLEDFDVCLYLAGNSDHSIAQEYPIYAIRQNTFPLISLLKHFRSRLIYLSSGAVYYGLEGLVGPQSCVQPAFPYAISKLTNELYIKSCYERGFLESWLIIRFYYAFGPFENQRRFVPKLIHHLLTQPERPFTITPTLMSPMYIDDTVHALGMIVQHKSTNRIIDFCSTAPIRLIDLANEVASTLKIQPLWDLYNAGERPIEFWSTNKELETTFNLEPPQPIKEGLYKYLYWLKTYGPDK